MVGGLPSKLLWRFRTCFMSHRLFQEKRDKIKFIRGSIEYKDLTNMAKNALPEIIENIIRENEKRFIEFFNTSRMITPRMNTVTRDRANERKG